MNTNETSYHNMLCSYLVLFSTNLNGNKVIRWCGKTRSIQRNIPCHPQKYIISKLKVEHCKWNKQVKLMRIFCAIRCLYHWYHVLCSHLVKCIQLFLLILKLLNKQWWKMQMKIISLAIISSLAIKRNFEFRITLFLLFNSFTINSVWVGWWSSVPQKKSPNQNFLWIQKSRSISTLISSHLSGYR